MKFKKRKVTGERCDKKLDSLLHSFLVNQENFIFNQHTSCN